MDSLFSDSDHEQKYHEQPKIINYKIGDDQINSDIIFDDPIVDVNNGSVEHDKNAHASYELEQLARNAYKEAEKQQIIANKIKQQNVALIKQLEQYKENVQVLETTKENKTNYHTKFNEADRKAKRVKTELQNQFIQNRDKIRVFGKRTRCFTSDCFRTTKTDFGTTNAQTVLKRQMIANEDKYLDDVLNLEAKLKTNEIVVIKMSQSVQAMFMVGSKPLSFL
ncbi:hypothetical protein Tco_1237787 [Tanacetum coccineum]